MFVAYLLDSDTVAYGISDMGIGNTREEAIAKLRAKIGEEIWPEVEDGEAKERWTGLRLFVLETN